jgi:cupin 2 domain-containing protein
MTPALPVPTSLYADLPQAPAEEQFLTLCAADGGRVERIVSHGHASPSGFWYDQDEEEWVLLLRGAATLEFADGRCVDLTPGEHLTIPRRCRHRVAATDLDTVWLAVFLAAGDTQSMSQ